MKTALIILTLWAKAAVGDEANCLASIMHAEAQGESLEGLVAIGQSSIKKARLEKTTLCKLKGVHRLTPSKSMVEYYVSVANHLLKNPKETISLGSTHWDKGKPHMPGIIRRVVGRHTFYELKNK